MSDQWMARHRHGMAVAKQQNSDLTPADLKAGAALVDAGQQIVDVSEQFLYRAGDTPLNRLSVSVMLIQMAVAAVLDQPEHVENIEILKKTFQEETERARTADAT